MLANVPWRRRAGVAALSLALAAGAGTLAFSASAADNGPAAQPDGSMHHDWEQHREQRLVKELDLNPQQAQLAAAAMAKMRPSPDMMKRMHDEHERHLLALMDPNFDPRKAAAEEDQMRAEHEAHMKEARNAWFALWDSLNAEQRTKARLMLIAMEEHHGHGHWGHGQDGHGPEGRGGPDWHGADGQGPGTMPPPPRP